MKRVLLVALSVGALLLAACSSSKPSRPQGSELVVQNQVGQFQGAGLVPPEPRPSFTLTDTSGRPFSFGTQTAGHPTFLYFGYTNCPDICPATMADIRIALGKVPASVAKKTYVAFVTTDVKYDTAAVIKQWLGNFDSPSAATWIGLRGTQAQIDAAQAAAHIALAEDGGKTHAASVKLYGPDDYARVMFLNTNGEEGQMAHDLPVVAGS